MAAIFHTQTRGAQHPEREQMQQYAFSMLAACGAARQIAAEQFEEWMARERLNDPEYFLPALSAALSTMVGADGWLFDRATVQ